MYGTKDAGTCFDAFAESVMKKLGFSVGVFSPCIYYCKEKNMVSVRHGDDFLVLATRAQHKQFHKGANEHMILKEMGPWEDTKTWAMFRS